MYDNWEDLEKSILECKNADYAQIEPILYLDKEIKRLG